CGFSPYKARKLSNTALTGPLNIPGTRGSNVQTGLQCQVYPNPSSQAFTLQVQGNTFEKVQVRILDRLGRAIQTLQVFSNQVNTIGNDLPNGAYMLEVRQGNEMKIIRLMKLSQNS
ncbi:MAG: T9SS type A sorting domain-containing protein, partial [Bacteroidota bacterium]